MLSKLRQLASWFDDRVGLRELIEKNLTGYGVPKRSTGILFCLGGLALMMFLVQHLLKCLNFQWT